MLHFINTKIHVEDKANYCVSLKTLKSLLWIPGSHEVGAPATSGIRDGKE